MTHKQRAIVSALCLIVAGGLVFFYQTKSTPQLENKTENQNVIEPTPIVIDTQEPKEIKQELKKEYNSSINLIFGSDSLDLQFKAGLSLFEVLTKAAADKKITLLSKEYPPLGFFVTQIGNLKDGEDGKHLFYYINGQEATVGASDYILKDGDRIEWKLKN